MNSQLVQIIKSFVQRRPQNRDIPFRIYWQQMIKYYRFAKRFPTQKESWIHPTTYLFADIQCVSDQLTLSADPLDPVLIVVVKDDLRRMKELFPHYQSIGIHQFIILDNMSSDGTRDFCARQANTRVYTVNDPYLTEKKEAWIERVITLCGVNRWYAIADSDEFLNYYGSEHQSVQELVRLAEANGIPAVKAILLDMYRDKPLFSESDLSQPLRKQFRYFDRDGYSSYYARHGIQRVLIGGPRMRVMHSHEHMSKYPLLKYDKHTYLMTAHILWRFTAKEDSPFWCVCQHYKFLQEDLQTYKSRIVQKNFGAGSRGYRTIIDEFESHPERTFMYSGSTEYVDSASLLCLPLQSIPWTVREEHVNDY